MLLITNIFICKGNTTKKLYKNQRWEEKGKLLLITNLKMFSLTADPTIPDTITISNVCKKVASGLWESPHSVDGWSHQAGNKGERRTIY